MSDISPLLTHVQNAILIPEATADICIQLSTPAQSPQPPQWRLVTESAQAKKLISKPDYARKYLKATQDVETLSTNQLRQRYKLEYGSWSRAKDPTRRQPGIEFDETFSDFRAWLIHLGPRPRKTDSADRIDGTNGYAPGNLRWATKQEQAENRKSTHWIPWAGRRFTRKGFAKEFNIPYKRLCKQFERGWQIAKIVEASGKPLDPVDAFLFPAELAPLLDSAYRKRDDSYLRMSRAEWLPQYYSDLALEEKRTEQRQHFQALEKKAKKVFLSLQAERDSIRASARDELLSKAGPLDVGSPPAISPAVPKFKKEPPAKFTPEEVAATMAMFSK